ncbi:hypothetical protein BIT28_19355 [Photobacterium proteolyticum]|uniref:Transposase n=1 Tax=Photobacterium proteolyticum TaxID=1903952 RepID=A0A1Q9H7H3_9GAMM|nr:hypothetical protein [Photobacterium proteolyticum]OLQ83932.1 hypothetical protein BIT28_19355 [Photobacterium proteolyticum]
MTREEKHDLWNERLQNQKESSLTIAAWCEQNQIVQSQFYYWQKKLTSSVHEPDSVVVPLSMPSSLTALVIETPNGYRVSINDASAITLLPQLIKCLS